jgi:hypothetical protein
MGHGHLKVDSYVVTLTQPGAPRMPNGIECELDVGEGEHVVIGDGGLHARGLTITTGPIWDARPDVNVHLEADPYSRVDGPSLLGRGPGLTPQGDDVLIGYLAGLNLFESHNEELQAPLTGSATTTSLSTTLLLHAGLGELPEPAHALLESGDPDPLMGFGHSSGRALLLGLALACPAGAEGDLPARTVVLRDIAGFPPTSVHVFQRRIVALDESKVLGAERMAFGRPSPPGPDRNATTHLSTRP